ncbi:phage Gp37/Gp68 family protein [Pseudomonas neustonica]|uniref:Phage Gp37/Gp68 family protein n=1 Tax=Pseudomonas neustonica TaxID=2487346 RepID=A0ABX9XEP4_9PSED|nr:MULTISPECIES: phage Gp37/Gp68 family protein [Pseudomonas]ROZ80912.1 phage Gp37/Gp68 family protein [Pseudomonas sp. SSM44]ROZ82109.1 phage Gp37/Gp68 family protein [Pseudomonas neustonica]
MADKTGIEWTDATWNPIRGCSRVSEGCRNCYAEGVAKRFSGPGMPYEGLIAKGGQWNGKVRVVESAFDQPLRWVKPRRIFVNSMSDLFHEDVPFDVIAMIFSIMSVTTRHTYQILTKRPERMLAFFEWACDGLDYPFRIAEAWPPGLEWKPAGGGRGGYDNCGPNWPYENVWLGVSVEDQATADARIPLLLEAPAAVRWISAEPLLGPVNLPFVNFWCSVCGGTGMLGRFPGGACTRCAGRGEIPAISTDPRLGMPSTPMRRIDWVVAGGESGPKARPMHPEWAGVLRDQCVGAGVPFLFKQWGEWAPRGPAVMGYPSVEGVLRIRLTDLGENGSDLGAEGDNHAWMQRIGNKAAGRLLDGVLHDAYPGVANV